MKLFFGAALSLLLSSSAFAGAIKCYQEGRTSAADPVYTIEYMPGAGASVKAMHYATCEGNENCQTMDFPSVRTYLNQNSPVGTYVGLTPAGKTLVVNLLSNNPLKGNAVEAFNFGHFVKVVCSYVE